MLRANASTRMLLPSSPHATGATPVRPAWDLGASNPALVALLRARAAQLVSPVRAPNAAPAGGAATGPTPQQLATRTARDALVTLRNQLQVRSHAVGGGFGAGIWGGHTKWGRAWRDKPNPRKGPLKPPCLETRLETQP